MPSETDVKPTRAGSWLAGTVLAFVHLIAFGMLYLLLVQLSWSFQEFYRVMGVRVTQQFEWISLLSNEVAASTPLVILLIAMDIVIVLRLALKGSRWTAAYSHAVLVCIGCTGFL